MFNFVTFSLYYSLIRYLRIGRLCSNRIGSCDSNSNRISNRIGHNIPPNTFHDGPNEYKLNQAFSNQYLITSETKRDVWNYGLLIPVIKHIEQYRHMITHRASKSVYCTTGLSCSTTMSIGQAWPKPITFESNRNGRFEFESNLEASQVPRSYMHYTTATFGGHTHHYQLVVVKGCSLMIQSV